RVLQAANGTLRFIYDDAWRASPDALPLSVSMPLSAAEHGHDTISAWLWGLLPDSERTLDHYGRLFGVSPRNPVALLAHIGADCAGAVQFAPPEQADEFLASASQRRRVTWLTEREVGQELRSARERGVPGTDARTLGQFSLAGAQPKIALLHDAGRWGTPHGRTPTTHILKPPSREFPGFAENEHFCLTLARALGLAAASSRVQWFGDEVAIIVQRYDRVRRGSAYHRVHQEDTCQALAVMPTRKYENQGGPGIADIVALLRDVSSESTEDIARFLDAAILNWVLAATDAHAKNYSLLIGRQALVRLAPFYDMASYLPYADTALHRVRLAMQVGGEYLVRRITPAHWLDAARRAGLEPDVLAGALERQLAALPEAIERTRIAAISDGLDAQVINALADRVAARTRECSAMQQKRLG
ncbi:MAG TPA: type II toxin-antitoxin system HipA family toxin, partial [Gemmatimonadaceae bacterium]|nr:type II toxin-antitoxin system HipA family toxin [Gemmatimonadaceae bacterium]